MQIMNELTYLAPHIEETNILSFDDPDLFKYPVAYLCEPGPFFNLTDRRGRELPGLPAEGRLRDRRRFPGAATGTISRRRCAASCRTSGSSTSTRNPARRSIFHSFFEIDAPQDYPNFYDQGKPIFRGIFENNDPTKRLMAIINYNTDISEFWEFSGTGLKPIRRIERRVQARRELHHLRNDALVAGSEVPRFSEFCDKSALPRTCTDTALSLGTRPWNSEP